MKIDRSKFLTLTTLVAATTALGGALAGGCTIVSKDKDSDAGPSTRSDAATDAGPAVACIAAPGAVVVSDAGNGDASASDASSDAAVSDASTTSDAGTGIAPTCEGMTGPCSEGIGLDVCYTAEYDANANIFAEIRRQLGNQTGTCTEEEATGIVDAVLALACPDATAAALCDTVKASAACAGAAVSDERLALCKRVIVAANQQARDAFTSCMVEGVAACGLSETSGCLPLVQ